MNYCSLISYNDLYYPKDDQFDHICPNVEINICDPWHLSVYSVIEPYMSCFLSYYKFLDTINNITII